MLIWTLGIIGILIVFIISALPLYFAVKFFGGKTGILKVIITNILVAGVIIMIRFLFDSWSGLLGFIMMIWIYKELFELGLIKALLAWLLQFIFAALIALLLNILGIPFF